MGFHRVETIDDDLGISGADSLSGRLSAAAHHRLRRDGRRRAGARGVAARPE